MKLFLRYQISGMVFIIWCVIFYHGGKASGFKELLDLNNISLSARLAVAIAIASPIGVLIHQLSVLIKNCLVAKKYEGFNDHPERISINLDYSKDSNKYYLDHISSLNSFYYVRVDNAVIAPILAFIFVLVDEDFSIFPFRWMLLATLIAIVTIYYVPRINEEIECYYDNLKVNPFKANPFKKNHRVICKPCSSWVGLIYQPNNKNDLINICLHKR